MQAHKDFLVHIPERYKGGVKTKSGVEIKLDKNFSGKDLANNVFEVINVPMDYKGKIKPGFRVLVDPIVVHNQTFQKHGEEQNQNLVNREKKHYKVDPRLIICYSMGEETEFKAFGDNLICEKYEPKEKEEKIEKIGSIFIPDMSRKNTDQTPLLRVMISNKESRSQGINEGDLIYNQEFTAIDITIRDQKFMWIKNHHALGKLLKEAV
jgi:co-chaperonin GroES (HSP10)